MVHPWEEFYRIKQFIHNRIIDRYYAFRFRNSSSFINNHDIVPTSTNKVSIDRFNFTGKDLNRYRFYKCSLNLNKKINWRYDYKNKIESPIKLHSKIDKNSFKEVGELKYTLEPSRFNFLPFYTLGFLKKESNITYSPLQHVKDWFEANPYLFSFNWKDGIEVGIRSINLCYTYSILNQNSSSFSEMDKRLMQHLIYLHFWFLKNHLSKYSSSNNHFISELIGLYVITSFFTFRSSEKWRDYSQKQLIKQFSRQFHKDGFSTEQSTCYHKDVLSQYSIFISLANYREDKFLTNDFLNKVEKAFESLIAFRVCENIYFQVGDNDNSFIINDYSDPKFSEYESILNDYSIIFNKPFFCNPDQRNFLIWPEEKTNNRALHRNETTTISDTLLEYSGYYIHKSKSFSTLFDFGGIGFKYGAAHGHSDMLSFQLYVQNKPFFTDMGTFQYHKKEIWWRNYFRGIHSHNTASINQKHHSHMMSNMIWDPISHAELLDHSLENDNLFCEAEFNFSKNNKHNRMLIISGCDEISIIDTIIANPSTNFSVYFHLHPDCLTQISNDTVFEITNAKNKIVLDISGDYSRLDTIEGDLSLPLGWYSSSYDRIEPTKVIRIQGTTNQSNCRIQTNIKIINE